MNNVSKTALVSGASRGIGKAIAEELAMNGWDLILTCSKSMKELERFAAYLRGEAPGEDEDAGVCTVHWHLPRAVSVRCVQCDMGDPEQVRALFREIDALDLVVNNAGIPHYGLLQDMSDEEWDRVLAVNLSSVFYTSRAAIPLFLRQGYGRIINISSVWGSAGASCEAAYSASKGGVNALTKALARELAPSHIPVNAIACGCVDTAMNRHLTGEERSALEEEIPYGRFARPEEVAAAVAELAEMPAYLTGQIITMDGGWT